MELKEIKAIIDLMKKNDLAVFKLEKEGFKLELEAQRPVAPIVTAAPSPPAATVAPIAASPVPAPAAETRREFKEIVSPMVGTFYRAPSPESAPYVQVGQDVDEETVVCIIEAMKVMNEIKAEMRGVIAEVLVENGTPVQFGQPLFRVN
ncbi:MAG: acetyl-CoA carboxylase biotin carboxyl carrier protein [Verrucomicrobia bacterium]|nr:acetyl-CoA carboxylase biotin carboxyl carrier protein [Verrucomicrobiota bacterium]